MKLKGIFTIFFIGILCICGGTFFTVINGGNYEKTDAVISRIDTVGQDGKTNHRVYVNYSVNGTDYRGVRIRAYDDSMREGDTVEVEYSSADPGSTRMRDDHTLIIVLFVLGGLALAYALTVVTIKAFKSRK